MITKISLISYEPVLKYFDFPQNINYNVWNEICLYSSLSNFCSTLPYFIVPACFFEGLFPCSCCFV